MSDGRLRLSGMRRAIADSAAWEHKKAIIYAETAADDPASLQLFTASVVNAIYSGEAQVERLYEGDSLPAAVEAVNRRLAEAEASGALDHLVEHVPRRMDLREVWRQLEVLRRKVDQERGVSRARRHGPVEQIRCPLSELDDVEPLQAKDEVEIYAATHQGLPALCRVEVEATGDPRDRQGESDEREAQVTVFASADDRLVRLAEGGIYRERDESLRELLREQYWLLGHGRGSEEHFEQAYTVRGFEKAIESLPCASCGAVCWPVIQSPKEGSAEWWEDPFATYNCRVCGYFLAQVGDGTSTSEPSREYPFTPPSLPSPPLQATM